MTIYGKHGADLNYRAWTNENPIQNKEIMEPKFEIESIAYYTLNCESRTCYHVTHQEGKSTVTKVEPEEFYKFVRDKLSIENFSQKKSFDPPQGPPQGVESVYKDVWTFLIHLISWDIIASHKIGVLPEDKLSEVAHMYFTRFQWIEHCTMKELTGFEHDKKYLNVIVYELCSKEHVQAHRDGKHNLETGHIEHNIDGLDPIKGAYNVSLNHYSKERILCRRKLSFVESYVKIILGQGTKIDDPTQIFSLGFDKLELGNKT